MHCFKAVFMNLPFSRLVLVCSLLAVLVACSQDNEAPEPTHQDAHIVKTYEVIAESSYLRRQFVGEIMAKSTVELSFQVPGRLLDIPVEQGDVVAEGTLLAVLDDSDYRLAVRNAQADLNLARADVLRKRNLVERGAVSEIEREVAEANYEQAQVQLDSAEQDLARTRLYAPYDAMVAQRLVDPQTMVAPEVPVLMLQNMSELRVRTQVPETFFERLVRDFSAENGHDARLTGRFEASLLSTPTERYPLVYREHVSQAVASTQTYQVEFAFANYEMGETPLIALPGMVANVSIQIPTTTDSSALRIPIGALKSVNEDEFYVYVLNEALDRVHEVPVTLSHLSADSAHIKDGLEGGEIIVAAGAHHLEDGDDVKTMDEAL